MTAPKRPGVARAGQSWHELAQAFQQRELVVAAELLRSWVLPYPKLRCLGHPRHDGPKEAGSCESMPNELAQAFKQRELVVRTASEHLQQGVRPRSKLLPRARLIPDTF